MYGRALWEEDVRIAEAMTGGKLISSPIYCVPAQFLTPREPITDG
jgi:hypothetical protein